MSHNLSPRTSSSLKLSPSTKSEGRHSKPLIRPPLAGKQTPLIFVKWKHIQLSKQRRINVVSIGNSCLLLALTSFLCYKKPRWPRRKTIVGKELHLQISNMCGCKKAGNSSLLRRGPRVRKRVWGLLSDSHGIRRFCSLSIYCVIGTLCIDILWNVIFYFSRRWRYCRKVG